MESHLLYLKNFTLFKIFKRFERSNAFRLYLKDLYTVSVVFEVYQVAPCGSMRLHAAPCIFRLYLKDLYAATVIFEVYEVAPCGSMHL